MSAGASPHTPLGELIAFPRPPSWFRGGNPEKGKREGTEREGRGRWDWDPPPGTGREGKGMEEGWGRRVGKGMGRKGTERK